MSKALKQREADLAALLDGDFNPAIVRRVLHCSIRHAFRWCRERKQETKAAVSRIQSKAETIEEERFLQ